jgi:ElaB/YqjD/DUF883 family membrane-anchored ribosome-binding protein
MRDEDLEPENQPAESAPGSAAGAVPAQTSEPSAHPVHGHVEQGSPEMGEQAESSARPVAGGPPEFTERIAQRTAALRERRAALRRRQAELMARARERRTQRAVGVSDEDQAASGAALSAATGSFADERPATALVVGLLVGLLVGWLLGRR